MLFLFDANVLITASNTYYPMDQIPEFWAWIAYQANLGRIKLPLEILEEVIAGTKKGDPLIDWIKEHKEPLLLNEIVDPERVREVLVNGYAPDLTDLELEAIGQDPFLIAYVLGDTDRCVVTVEGSKPSKQRQNKRVPDVCKDLGVMCRNPFQAYRELGFRTAWKP